MKRFLIALILITLVGGFLRFYKVTQNPPGLNVDEIAIGYDAYSISRTAHDMHGKYLPLTFESIGDYKNPFFEYFMVPFIKIFGPTDLAVKFPSALMGTLTIPVFFLFLLDILKNKKVATIGSFLLAISPWHIFYSRIAYEGLTASLFVLIGVWFFIKMHGNKPIWAFLSAFFLSLTMYTAQAPKLFVPAFVLGVLIISFLKPNKNSVNLKFFILSCLIMALPMISVTLFAKGGERFNMVFISHDIEFSRYVLLKYFNSIADIPALFFYWVKRYLSYFDPGFIFLYGLDATLPSPVGLGMLYIFELPLLIIGTLKFIKTRFVYKNIFIVWLLAGIFPDSLTNNEKQAGRLLHIFPVVIFLSSLGAIEIINWIKNTKNIYKKALISISAAIIVFVSLAHAFLIIGYDFPTDKGEQYNEGMREVISFVSKNQDRFKEIFFDTRRGIDAPSMISNPYLYLLFYLKYDPITYQTEPKILKKGNDPMYHFGKYTFGYIDWHQDCYKKDILFIGSPWSFPVDLAGANIIQKFQLNGGRTAFYAVTSNLKCPYGN